MVAGTNGTPPPMWPMEQTIWWIVLYYENNETNTPPTTTSGLMQSLESAIEQARTYITDAGNVGVCTISQVSGFVVYPSIPWEDF